MKGLFSMIALAAVALAGFGYGQSSMMQVDDCPNGKCQRTVPFNATTAPVFDAPPAVGVGSVAPVVNVDPAVVTPSPTPVVVVNPTVPEEPKPGLNLTDEQKEALKGMFFQLATVLIGIFVGRGTTSPIVSAILTSVLEYLKSRQPAAPKAPAATRKRRLRKQT